MSNEPAARAASISRRTLIAGGAAAVGTAAINQFEPAAALTTTSVRKAQKWLNGLGYWCGTPDGVIGELTTCAMLAYQKVNRLPVNGVIDDRMFRRLKLGYGKHPRFTKYGRILEVDLGRQVVRDVKNGKVLTTLHATTGNGLNDTFGARPVWNYTPRGTFRISDVHTGTVPSPLGLGDQHHPHVFLEPYAIYGVGSMSATRAPATKGGVAVHYKAINWLAGVGGITHGRTVVIA